MINRKCLLFVTFIILMIISVMLPVMAFNYIGNSNTHRFHYPDCSSISKMNPNHKVYIDSREQAINEGYIPCKRCNP